MVPQRVRFDAATRIRFAATDARRDALQVPYLSRSFLPKLGTAQGVSDKVRSLPKLGSEMGVPDKVRRGVSDKVSSPQGTVLESVLLRVADASTRQRGSCKGDRRELRFPAYRASYGRGANYYSKVWSYLQRWGLRTLNDLQGQGLGEPSQAQLVKLFEDRVLARGKVWTKSPTSRSGAGLERGTVAMLADKAAEAVLRDWNRDWIASRREAGRRGGEASHGGPAAIVGPSAVQQLRVLERARPGLTRREQAELLGWSRSTLARVVQLSKNKP